MASTYITVTDNEDPEKWYVIEVYDSWSYQLGHGRVVATARGGNSTTAQRLIDGLANST